MCADQNSGAAHSHLGCQAPSRSIREAGSWLLKRLTDNDTRLGVPADAGNPARQLPEEALLTAGALQKAILNSANFSSIGTDAKGVIRIFNVGAEVLNKITPADISDLQEVIARAQALSVELETPIQPGFDALVFKASRGIEDIYELT